MIGFTTLAATVPVPSPAGAASAADVAANRAATGWTYEEAAEVLLDTFDHNGDGTISDDRIFGLRLFSEARSSTSSARALSFGLLEGRPDLDLVRVRRTRTWSLDRLVARADTNGDHIATRSEIAAVIRSYDTDRDGRLSVTEFARLRAELGAELLRTWRWVDEYRRPGRSRS